MKKIIILLILIVIFGIISPSYAIGESGKYQLFQGYYDEFDLKNNTKTERKAIFKIDTVTGKVWKYVVGIAKDGNPFEDWQPVFSTVKRYNIEDLMKEIIKKKK